MPMIYRAILTQPRRVPCYIGPAASILSPVYGLGFSAHPTIGSPPQSNHFSHLSAAASGVNPSQPQTQLTCNEQGDDGPRGLKRSPCPSLHINLRRHFSPFSHDFCRLCSPPWLPVSAPSLLSHAYCHGFKRHSRKYAMSQLASKVNSISIATLAPK